MKSLTYTNKKKLLITKMLFIVLQGEIYEFQLALFPPRCVEKPKAFGTPSASGGCLRFSPCESKK